MKNEDRWKRDGDFTESEMREVVDASAKSGKKTSFDKEMEK